MRHSAGKKSSTFASGKRNTLFAAENNEFLIPYTLFKRANSV